ncbi:MAG: ABC transporter ATP-binding protein [Peptococcaceae bacterium]|nr:ABC transporter ATP-binding protein [Peptococcaceae bacterium]
MLEVENLCFSYRSPKAGGKVLDGLSVAFGPGFNVVLGPNGAGKSTLLKCIFGLLKAQGQVRYGDLVLSQMPFSQRVQLLSYLPQIEAQPENLRVLETVLLGRLPELGHTVEDEDLDIVMEMLQRLHIDGLALRKTGELSGGQQKLVHIAQTLVRRPKLILMDEPFGSLDLQKQLELCQMMKELTGNGGPDLVTVLHDINLAARYAAHIAVLDEKGRLYSFGAPREVITEQMLRDVYGVRAHLSYDGENVPVVSPVASIRAAI